MKIGRIAAGTVLLASIVVAAYAVTLFTHTFPQIPANVAVLSTTCSTLELVPGQTVVANQPGTVALRCSAIDAAFTVNTPGGSASPTFTLPAPYTQISYWPQGGVIPCSVGSPNGNPPFVSGSAYTFPSSGNFNYCAEYSAPSGGLPSFTLTWSQ